MSAGYVYILINNSLEGLVKIGSTTLGAKERAKQLSSNTGIPTPFIVAYETYIDNYIDIEKKIHKELSDFRINPNREFFKYPLNKAIELLQSYKSNIKDVDKFEAIEIMPLVIERYGKNIDSTISSIRICQDGERVYFEFTKDEYIAEYLKDQIITRSDLGFIGEDYDDYLFKPEYHISHNVDIFLDFDDISMANCVGEIFIKEWQPKK